jgi:hypothetical protein
MDEQAI